MIPLESQVSSLESSKRLKELGCSQEIAAQAYKIADAMLQERQKEGK